MFACLFKGAKYKVIFVFGFYPVGKMEFGRLSNLVWLPETALPNSIQQLKKKKKSLKILWLKYVLVYVF